ncbi:MAG TPA: alpha/beta hydrolase, partial [Hyphomonas sp.]|nr:alpha/beta hydrolase [Hyphomonas sp.]
MNLDQTIRQFIDRFTMPDLKNLDWKATAERLRQQFYVASHAIEKDAPEMADISHLLIPGGAGGVKARFYTPLGAGIAPGPGIVFFHGGGFVIGDLESHDMLCKRLAEGSRCRVLAIDYRLAPENKFPSAHEDAVSVWRWVQANAAKLGLDPERL